MRGMVSFSGACQYILHLLQVKSGPGGRSYPLNVVADGLWAFPLECGHACDKSDGVHEGAERLVEKQLACRVGAVEDPFSGQRRVGVGWELCFEEVLPEDVGRTGEHGEDDELEEWPDRDSVWALCRC